MVEVQAFTKKCFVDLSQLIAASETSVDLSLRAMVKDVTFSSGGTTLSSNSLINDGCIPILENEAKTTISITGYVVSIGNPSGITVNSIKYQTGLDALFYGSADGTEPLSVNSESTVQENQQIRLVWLWTNDTTATVATSTTAATTDSLRRTYANGYLVGPPSFEWTGDPRVLEMSADFEFVPRNKYGFPNYHFESGKATALPALNSYNVTNYGDTVASRTW